MPRVLWPLCNDRPCIQVILFQAPGGQPLPRTLLADTGAGSRQIGFDLVLDENDCLLCGGSPGIFKTLGGVYTGSFLVYDLRVSLLGLGFDHHLRVVGVPTVPAGFHGLACFSFLNRFTYGNFGDPGQFGLEC